MSAAAPGIAGPVRVLRFWNTTIGKKAVMAVSGIILAGFVLAHLIGNLQIFLGPDQFNGYARTLRHLPELIWPARVILLIMVLLHIWSSLQLAVVKSEARPVGYSKHTSTGSTYASRTMYLSGPDDRRVCGLSPDAVHLRRRRHAVSTVRRLRERDSTDSASPRYRSFTSSRWRCCACIFGTDCGACFRSLGFSHPRHTPRIKRAALLIALFIFFGFASIPVAVMLKVIPQVI